MSMPRNRRETEIRERKIRAGVITSCAILGLLGIIACGYGHAAFSSDLMISGEATVKNSNDRIPFPITYLQDMTPEICANATYRTESQLIDKRDGKKYWVRKQYDGSCWMVQNLALDITSEGLTSELSDLHYSSEAQYEEETKPNGEVIYKWNENSKYPPVDSYTYFTGAGSNYTTTWSWNLGDWVMTNNDLTQCVANRYGPEACSQVTYVGPEIETDENTGESVIVGEGYKPDLDYMSTGMTFDSETRTYDAHYLIGNYYQYRTATAGSFVRAKNALNPSSICPKGWRLPTSDNATIVSPQQEAVLAAQAYEDATGETIDLTAEPLYLIRAGYIDTTQYTAVGRAGYWAMNRTNGPNAGGSVLASGTNNNMRDFIYSAIIAYRADSVRCVARNGLEEE